MNSSSLANLGSRFLCGLSSTETKLVLDTAMQWQFPTSAIAVQQGDRADRLFMVAKGSARYFVETEEGRKLLLLWLAPGDIFGGSALLEEPCSYLCGVEVTKLSKVLVWDRRTIRHLSSKYPQLTNNALAIASDYLIWYVATHVALTCTTARERVAKVLLSLANGIGHKVPQGIVLEITNEQLSNASNVTLFTSSRLTAEWHRTGAIVKKRGEVLVCHPERLL